MIDSLIDEFYRVCYTQGQMYIVYTSNTPQAMIVENSVGDSDWIEWKLVKRSTSIVSNFAEFEQEIGYTLPISFKLWHSRYYTLDGDIGIVRLPAIPLGNPFAPLQYEIFETEFPDEFRQNGYLPFATIGDGSAALCFHTKAESKGDEYPIYAWEYYTNESERFLTLIFSSFTKLLECCIHFHGGTLNYPTLPVGVNGFAIIDPEGAGKYWVSH